jgi:glycosyltransferase involved in cell wall biosynthesis
MKPKVLIIGPTPPPYFGVAVNTKALLEHAAMQRFDVLHLDTSDRRDTSNMGKFDVTNITLALKHGAEFLAALVRHRPDLVYLPISPSMLGLVRDLEFLLPAAGRTVLVIHQRGGQMRNRLLGTNRAVRAAVRYVFARTSRVIVLGNHFRPDFSGLVDDERIVVVHNGVDPSPYLARRRARTDDKIRVLYMGILLESKGYRLLLEVARRLPAIAFQFAGDYMNDTEREFTERFVHEHRLSNVELLGVVSGDQKIATLCDADIFAFPTAYPYEGHPTVIIEAMAAGLPIVSTRHVAIPETMTDGEEGFLVDTNDVDALALAIEKLASDGQLRARMGARSRATLLARFTLDHCVEQIVAVFTSALGEAS